MYDAATATLANPFGFLDYTVKYYAVWDVLRLLSTFSTLVLVIPYSRIAFGNERPEEAQGHETVVTIRIGILAFICAVVPLVLTELQQVGHRAAPWRLPFVILLNVFGWWYVKRRL